MRLHRFYLQNENFETLRPGDSFTCTHPETVKQVGLVLRAQIGDKVRFFNETSEWEFEMMSVSKKELLCVTKKLIARLLQKKRVILVQSLIKKDKFEWVAQKVTELGVTDIVPVVSERSEKRGLDEKRLQKIIVEATEQSGWGRMPILHPISTLEETLAELTKQDISLYVLDMGEVRKAEVKEKSLALCVGPEGGWGEHDQDIFKKYSVEMISLGASVLRAETAAIVGSYEFVRGQ